MPDMTIKVLPGAQEAVASGPFRVFLNTPEFLRVWENFPGVNLQTVINAYSNGTLSFYPVPLHKVMSLDKVVCMVTKPTGGGTLTLQWGLYSNNAGTLSILNSASAVFNTTNSGSYWTTLAPSSSGTIEAGGWYFGFNILSAGTSNLGFYGLSSVAPGNAFVSLRGGRVTASTNGMPASYAISALDQTGSDAMRFPYVVITS